jgi:hypothetical protein
MMRPPTLLLRARHRQAVWLPTLWVAGLAIAADVVAASGGVPAHLRLPATGITLLFAVALRWLRRRPIRRTAARLDLALSSSNRFEALVELGDRQDPLAAAVREETGAFFATRKIPTPYAWYAGWALLGIASLGELIPARSLAPAPQPPAPPVLAVAPAVRPHAVPVPPPEAPPVVLKWLAPAAVIDAQPNEFVPLWAAAESKTGLEQIELRIIRNGEEVPQGIPLPAVGPGTESLRHTLALADLAVHSADVVAYYISAARVRPSGTAPGPEWPRVESPLQIIRVRAVTDVADALKDPSETAQQRLVRELSAAQGALAPQIFGLRRHAIDAQGSAERDITAAEVALADRANDLRSTDPHATQEAAAPTVADQVHAAFSGPVKQSAATLGATAQQSLQNAARALSDGHAANALPSALKAMSDLAALEEELRREARAPRAGADAKASAAAPPPAARPQTPAGQLQRLAREQQALADELGQSTAGPNAFQRQDALVRELNRLVTTRSLESVVQPLVAQATTSADQAANQLNEGDPEAAKQPAALAAQQLHDAVSRMDAEARRGAMERIAAVQRALIHAAARVQDPALGGRGAHDAKVLVAKAVEALRQEAAQQVQQGAEAAAEEATRLAEAIDASKIQPELERLEQAGDRVRPAERDAAAATLLELAQAASDGRSALGDQDQLQAEALQALKNDAAGLNAATKANDDHKAEFAEKTMADLQQARSAAGQKSKDHEARDVNDDDPLTAVRQMFVTARTTVADAGSGAAGLRASRGLASKGESELRTLARRAEENGDVGRVESLTRVLDVVRDTRVVAQLNAAAEAGQVSSATRARLQDSLQKVIDAIDRATTDAKSPEAGGTRGGGQKSQGSQKAASRADNKPGEQRKGGESQQNDPGRAGMKQGGGGVSGTSAKPFASRLLGTLDFGAEMQGMIAILDDAVRSGERKHVLRVANPADAPPEYRPAVADYFEQLSREGTPR